MNVKIKIEKAPIITSVLFFLLGLILFIDFDGVINFVSYALGTIMIALGVYKLSGYYKKKINDSLVDYNEFGFGLVDIVLGILIIILSEAFTTILRFFVGGWILLAGINRFVQAISMPQKKSRFYGLLFMSLIVVAVGVYVILAKDSLDIIGLLMMIYAVIEIVENIVYFDKSNSTNKKTRSSEVIEANVVLETDTNKKAKKVNKKKKKTNE